MSRLPPPLCSSVVQLRAQAEKEALDDISMELELADEDEAVMCVHHLPPCPAPCPNAIARQVQDRGSFHPPPPLPRGQASREGPCADQRRTRAADIERGAVRKLDEGPQGDAILQVRARNQSR